MEHFVSIFDRAFLPQFLAWRSSVQRHYPDSCLWALCVDAAAVNAVAQLDLTNVEVIDWQSLETEVYRSVRLTRLRSEYCWTLTPRSVLKVMDAAPDASRVTYVDADMWLVASPRRIFDELESTGATVILSEHGFAPAFDKGLQNGRYCVQFMPFRRDGNRSILEDWELDCIADCSTDTSKGNFGDQKYLDEWQFRYGHDVAVLSKPQFLLAPWNMTRFPLSEAVAFHFHGLRLLPQHGVYLGDYEIPRWLFDHIYAPYLADLREAEALLASRGLGRIAQMAKPSRLAIWRQRRWHRQRRKHVPFVCESET